MLKLKKINQGTAAIISWVILIIINFLQLLFVKYTVPDKFSFEDVLYYTVTSFTLGVLLIYLFLLPVFKYVRRLKIVFQIPLFIIHGLVYTIIYIILIFFQIALWSYNLKISEFVEATQTIFSTDFHNIAKNYFFLLAIFISVEYVNKREKTLIRQTELENQLKEAKLLALESKLHPHFLFNALNGITALVNENPRKAEKAIIELSDLLRFTLEGNLQHTISLEAELDLLAKYISIEQMRHENQLMIDISIDNEIDITAPIIPPLILQPIIENMIKHGFKGIKHALSVSIHISNDKITFKNNGAPLQKDIQYGTGLRMIAARLNHHFQNEGSIKLFESDHLVICELMGPKF